jgi:hypothetical protein
LPASDDVDDFSGTPGIAGTVPDSGGNITYYPSVYGPNAFFNSQFHSLYAWRSIGNANYHAFQASVRKKMSNGIQFDFNYTFAKSMDSASSVERGIALELTDGAIELIAEAGWDPAYGARPLKRAIQRLVENPLAKALIEGRFNRPRGPTESQNLGRSETDHAARSIHPEGPGGHRRRPGDRPAA